MAESGANISLHESQLSSISQIPADFTYDTSGDELSIQTSTPKAKPDASKDKSEKVTATIEVDETPLPVQVATEEFPRWIGRFKGVFDDSWRDLLRESTIDPLSKFSGVPLMAQTEKTLNDTMKQLDSLPIRSSIRVLEREVTPALANRACPTKRLQDRETELKQLTELSNYACGLLGAFKGENKPELVERLNNYSGDILLLNAQHCIEKIQTAVTPDEIYQQLEQFKMFSDLITAQPRNITEKQFETLLSLQQQLVTESLNRLSEPQLQSLDSMEKEAFQANLLFKLRGHIKSGFQSSKPLVKTNIQKEILRLTHYEMKLNFAAAALKLKWSNSVEQQKCFIQANQYIKSINPEKIHSASQHVNLMIDLLNVRVQSIEQYIVLSNKTLDGERSKNIALQERCTQNAVEQLQVLVNDYKALCSTAIVMSNSHILSSINRQMAGAFETICPLLLSKAQSCRRDMQQLVMSHQGQSITDEEVQRIEAQFIQLIGKSEAYFSSIWQAGKQLESKNLREKLLQNIEIQHKSHVIELFDVLNNAKELIPIEDRLRQLFEQSEKYRSSHLADNKQIKNLQLELMFKFNILQSELALADYDDIKEEQLSTLSTHLKSQPNKAISETSLLSTLEPSLEKIKIQLSEARHIKDAFTPVNSSSLEQFKILLRFTAIQNSLELASLYINPSVTKERKPEHILQCKKDLEQSKHDLSRLHDQQSKLSTDEKKQLQTLQASFESIKKVVAKL